MENVHEIDILTNGDDKHLASDEISQALQTELKQYGISLRERIRLEQGELFENEDCRYAAVIVYEFLRAAKKYVHIFCGHLNKYVYGNQIEKFKEAITRGVEIRVVTCVPYENIESKPLADYLKKDSSIRSYQSSQDISHFIDVDGKMFRLETDDKDKTAVVCAYAPQYKFNREIMDDMVASFREIWDEASPIDSNAS